MLKLHYDSLRDLMNCYKRLLWLGLILVQGIHAPAQVASTVGRSLDQLTQESEAIIHGFIQSTTIEPHPTLRNLKTILVTVSVSETLKGPNHRSLVFRQYLWDFRANYDSTPYKTGQEVLLLLGPTSRYGLTSPVGLEQGIFHISRDSNGKLTAVNGRGNADLFSTFDVRNQTKGPTLSERQAAFVRQARQASGRLQLDGLEDLVRTLARTR
jgi:hypothetical protein